MARVGEPTGVNAEKQATRVRVKSLPGAVRESGLRQTYRVKEQLFKG